MGLFSFMFWGVFLLAAGIILLLKYAFNLPVASGKMIFGLFVLLVGVSLLMSNFQWKTWGDKDTEVTSFGSRELTQTQGGKSYVVVFGSGDFDATKLEPGEKVTINCIFGSCHIKLPKACHGTANCAFGRVGINDDNLYFQSKDYGEKDDSPTVNISCVFGGITTEHAE